MAPINPTVAQSPFTEAAHVGQVDRKGNEVETLPRIVMLSDSKEGLLEFPRCHTEV